VPDGTSLADLTIEDVARFPRPGTVVPARLGFTPGGEAVTYLLSAEGNLQRSLWRYDIASGVHEVIAGPPPAREFTREEELRRERMRLREAGVTDYAFAEKGAEPVLLVPLGGSLHLARGDAALAEIPGTAGAIDPRLTADGTRVAFVRDGELHVVDLATHEPRQLTSGAEDGLTNGLAEFIAQEELDRDRGYWWSPDGARIAFVEADTRHIPVYPIVHQGKDGVDIEPHRYPFAGEANARIRLGVTGVDGGPVSWLDLGPEEDIYLARAGWRPDGRLTAQVLSRDQKVLRLLVFDGGEARTLIEERSEPWLNLSHDTRFLESGEMLWSSERSGFRHLYLYDGEGRQLRQLTSGDWPVSHVLGVDEPRRLVYFQAGLPSVVERNVFAASLDGGEPRQVTSGGGWHDGVVSRDGAWLIDMHSAREAAPSLKLLAMPDGLERAVLFANEVSAASIGLEPPELVELEASDGTPLHGALYRPRGAPGTPAPIVVSVYGGPHAQRVADDWYATVDLRAQYLAQHGLVVLKVDNRGSANRGLAFEAPLHLRMGSVEVEDQVAGVRWLAANRDYADATRVGIYGWSYGGYMTLMAMARAPEVFHVGVAGAPVTHWDGYDTAYTERYMSTPAENPEGYREGSVMAHVDALAGKLLIVHGMIDENVHFRHTARLLVAMAGAGKDYELLIYPEERHMPRDEKGLQDQERKVLGFLIENLRA